MNHGRAGSVLIVRVLALVVIAMSPLGCGTRVEAPEHGATASAAPGVPIESEASTATGQEVAAENNPVAVQPNQPLPNGASPASPGSPAPLPSLRPGKQATESAGRPAIPAPGASVKNANGSKSPVVIAMIGALSGIPGETTLPVVRGVQYWVKSRNATDGLNGHPVRLLTYDSGGDPARFKAAMRKAVEQDHAIAFVANPDPFAAEAGADYLAAKRVPQVGTVGGETWAYSNPMYFPHQSTGDLLAYTAIASVANQIGPTGKTKLGLIICFEAQICSNFERVWVRSAKALGLEVVYNNRSSLGQPDFTAECLGARNAGAETIMIAMDSNAVARFAASCGRQNFRPTYASFASVLQDRMARDPNLANLIGPSNVFPYFQSGTPATDEFHRAVEKYGSGDILSVGTATGWAAAKLLERVGSALPEPPTSAALLQALWSLKSETLGGLTLPMTFVENQPAQPVACWFDIAIKNASWSSPNGFKLSCRQAPDL